jgi:signal transduction histidine kinase
MASVISKHIERLRQPEYTGKNRCHPCTITNFLITAALSAIVWWMVSIFAATAVLLISLLLIYLRGYLILGTPTLTKRYFPSGLLKWFDKYESQTSAEDEAIDIEMMLLEAEALVECETVDDLCLSEEFSAAWQERIASVRGKRNRRKAVSDTFNVKEDQLSIEEYGGAFVAQVNGNRMGQWESEAAFLADVAAAELLQDRIDEWSTMSTTNRSQLLGGLRLFLEDCPTCGEVLTLGEDTVESCCRSIDVVAITCPECDSRIFEVENPSIEA